MVSMPGLGVRVTAYIRKGHPVSCIEGFNFQIPLGVQISRPLQTHDFFRLLRECLRPSTDGRQRHTAALDRRFR